MKEKGSAHILLLLVVVGVIVLFSPIPSYNSVRTNCLLLDDCPKSGFNWNPSLYQRIQTPIVYDDFQEFTHQANEDMSDWETYTNGIITIKYPQSFTLKENQTLSTDGTKVDQNNTLTILSSDNDYSIEISLSPDDRISCEYLNLTDPSKINVAGIASNIFENTPCGPLGSTLIFSTDEEKYFQIVIETNTPYSEIQSEVSQIFSTFEFTNDHITEDDAAKMVREREEVQAYMNRMPANSVHIATTDRETYYLVQIYETKDMHTNTFNWYEVDKKTGEITPTF